jgi:hypothetical protein
MAAAAVPWAIAGASNPVGWGIVGGAALAGVFLAAGNKKGGSGDWREHEKQYPGKKAAEEGARHEKGSIGAIHHPEGDPMATSTARIAKARRSLGLIISIKPGFPDMIRRNRFIAKPGENDR